MRVNTYTHMQKLLKLIFVILFIISLFLNISLLNNLKTQSSYIDHLFNYKKAYIKLIEIIGVGPDEAENFLIQIENQKD